jgi:hypothetical protein
LTLRLVDEIVRRPWPRELVAEPEFRVCAIESGYGPLECRFAGLRHEVRGVQVDSLRPRLRTGQQARVDGSGRKALVRAVHEFGAQLVGD